MILRQACLRRALLVETEDVFLQSSGPIPANLSDRVHGKHPPPVTRTTSQVTANIRARSKPQTKKETLNR